MLMPSAEASALVLPALSVHVPLADCPVPSALSVAMDVHEAIPDKVSAPLKVTVTLVLFHPFAFAAGDAVALAVGAVLSMLMPVAEAEALEFPALSVQVPL